MSDKFEEWHYNKFGHFTNDTDMIVTDTYYNLCDLKSCFEYQQTKLDAQAEELAALRLFINYARDDLDWDEGLRTHVHRLMVEHQLIDADGKPTTLLTGEDK